jgi:hypothetical protein
MDVLDDLFCISDQFQLLSAPELQKRSFGRSTKEVKLLHAHAGTSSDTQLVLYLPDRQDSLLEKGFDTGHKMPASHRPEMRSARIMTITVLTSHRGVTPSQYKLAFHKITACAQACTPASQTHTPIPNNKRLPSFQRRTNGWTRR